ncbi:hypothetical protein LIER_09034 [Lithospermum erythrorhizon]|uniref:Replication protein A OB domain-containing protein n=1 Tax=Lithospermum erythrorhizon TaxID=34254 RepID=A0AAV3PEA3_LITER
MLHLFKVYDITNAQVKLIDPQYRILKNPFQWTLQRDTFIRPVSDVGPNLRYFFDRLTSFSLIAKHSTTKLSSVDIMGVVLAFENPTIVSTQEGPKHVQRFTFVDKEKIPISVSVWEEMSILQGPVLTEAAKTLSVVVEKRLGISSYKGVSLFAKNSSSFTVNPPLEPAIDLKSWINTKTKLKLEELLVDQSIMISKELVESGDKKIYTVSELENITKRDDYWVKGFLDISNEDQKFYYIGCSNCNSKTSTDEEDIEYFCNICQKKVVTVARPLIVMLITDGVNTKLSKLGENYDVSAIRAELHGKVSLMLLRQSTSSMVDDENTRTANKGKAISETQSPLLPLKRAMNDITITPCI